MLGQASWERTADPVAAQNKKKKTTDVAKLCDLTCVDP